MSLMLNAQEVPIHLAERGRVYRIGDTRVSLDTLIGAYNDGCSAPEIVEHYPSLRLADVHAVISYYLNHEAEIDAYLAQRRLEAEELRKTLIAEGISPADPAELKRRLQERLARGA